MTTTRSALRVAVSHLAYDLIIGLALLLALLLALVPWLVRAWGDPLQKRWLRQRLLGRLPPGIPTGRPVWIHAVSVGEVKAARPLVAALRARDPDLPLVISTGTVTGYAAAERSFPDVYVCHAPLDLAAVARHVTQLLDPRLLILLELELWPAWLRVADELGVPQVVLNGRITAGSFRHYRRFAWWLPEYDRLALVAAQDAAHAGRFTELGVPPERLAVTGSLKHDLVGAPDPAAVADLRARLGLPADGLPVFVAGSTHDGEDGPVVSAWSRAGGGRVAHLLLVPRHLERLKDIQRLLEGQGVAWDLRSEAAGTEASGSGAERPAERLLLVDSMGELELLFGLADVVFLGGSLVPVGGHNVLEPAAAGRPQLVGPHLESCRAEADLLAAAGALEVVPDGPALGARLADWLADPEACRRRGAAGAAAVQALRGAADADVAFLAEHGLLDRA